MIMEGKVLKQVKVGNYSRRGRKGDATAPPIGLRHTTWPCMQ